MGRALQLPQRTGKVSHHVRNYPEPLPNPGTCTAVSPLASFLILMLILDGDPFKALTIHLRKVFLDYGDLIVSVQH